MWVINQPARKSNHKRIFYKASLKIQYHQGNHGRVLFRR
jgi:hypothetical protein